MADPYFAPKVLEHSFEPRAVTTGFQPDDYVAFKLRVESAHLLFVLVLQLANDEFASFSFQITDRLLSCVKVNADIYCLHGASLQSHVTECTGREFNTHGGRRLLHNISTGSKWGRSSGCGTSLIVTDWLRHPDPTLPRYGTDILPVPTRFRDAEGCRC